MQKKHESPEFTVIKQNEANAKFFVASTFDSSPNPTESARSDAQYVYDNRSEEAGGNNSVW